MTAHEGSRLQTLNAQGRTTDCGSFECDARRYGEVFRFSAWLILSIKETLAESPVLLGVLSAQSVSDGGASLAARSAERDSGG